MDAWRGGWEGNWEVRAIARMALNGRGWWTILGALWVTGARSQIQGRPLIAKCAMNGAQLRITWVCLERGWVGDLPIA